jgi:pimeloyl-ACP methyl ester carboxylesterase
LPDVPVLATAGDLDPNVATREARQAARRFTSANVVEVPNAGHVPEGEPTGSRSPPPTAGDGSIGASG